MSEVLEQFVWESPAGKAYLAEQERQAQRQVYVEEIQTLRRQQESALPFLQERVEKARAKAAEALAAYKKAEREHREAVAECEMQRFSLSHRIERLELKLRDGADPQIDLRIKELWRQHERIRTEGFRVSRVYLGRSMETGEDRFAETSNSDTIVPVLEAIRKAIEECEKVKLLPLGPEGVAVQLDEICSRIPSLPGVSFQFDDEQALDFALREQSDRFRMHTRAVEGQQRMARAEADIARHVRQQMATR